MGCCSSKSSLEKSVLTEHDTVSLSLVDIHVTQAQDVGVESSTLLASDTPSGKLMDSVGVPLTRSDDVVEEASPIEHDIIFVDTPDSQSATVRMMLLQEDVNSADVPASLVQEDSVEEEEVTTMTTAILEAKDANEPSNSLKSDSIIKDVVEADDGGLRLPEPISNSVAQSGTFMENDTPHSSRSPGPRYTNPEDIPIQSMYHRVHLAEMEEQDAARKKELRVEAERHEQEVREFRASMLSTKD